MRKLALIVAAALIVSAPMLTTSTIDTFAATKAKAKAPQNNGFWMALGDNMSGKSVEAKSSKKAAKGGMRGKGKKSAKGGMGGKGKKAAKGGMGGGGMGGGKKK